MSYVTLAAVKQHLGIASATDDAYLNVLIAAAENIIDTRTARHFEQRIETRVYDQAHVTGNALRLDADLLDVSAVRTGNGDVPPLDAVWLWPLNTRPASRLVLGHGYYWLHTDRGLITVSGAWGYSETPPLAIVQAATELVADLYHGEDRRTQALEKGAQAFGMARELPPRVVALIDPFKRRGL